MKVIFWASDKSREIMLARAIGQAVTSDGHEFEIKRTGDYGEERLHEGPVPGTDVAIVFGVKGQSLDIIRDHRTLGLKTLYFDKGISRQKGTGGHTEYSRIFINGPSPAPYMMGRKYRADRFEALGLQIEPRRKGGDYVLVCGSSQKYHDFHRLPPSQQFAENVIGRLKKLTAQTIIYRPKPSDKAARPINGAAFSHASTNFAEALRRASVLVTHGSSAGVFAVLAGVPVIALGDSIVSPVAGKTLEDIAKPFWPSEALRTRWAYAMAHCQWTTEELADGTAWRWLRGEFDRLCG